MDKAKRSRGEAMPANCEERKGNSSSPPCFIRAICHSATARGIVESIDIRRSTVIGCCGMALRALRIIPLKYGSNRAPTHRAESVTPRRVAAINRPTPADEDPVMSPSYGSATEPPPVPTRTGPARIFGIPTFDVPLEN